MQRLKALVEQATPHEELKKWFKGYIPNHYKRLSIDMDEALELALIGYKEIGLYFNTSLYFTQSLIAGAVISEKYDYLTIVTTSQYGKSFLMARLGLYLAYKGNPVSVAGADSETASIIMGKTNQALMNADKLIVQALDSTNKSKVQKRQMSMSKQRLGFSSGGTFETKTLGERFNSDSSNQAMGNGCIYIIDEAALCSDKSLVETARNEIAKDDGTSYPYIQISNPHKPGWFYDDLTKEKLLPRELVIWCDARTTIEEGGVKPEKVLNSRFNRVKEKMISYWLCELPDSAGSMFEEMPHREVIYNEYDTYYFGIDSAYKGKDEIYISVVKVSENGEHDIVLSESINKGNKGEWIYGTTPKLVGDYVQRLVRRYMPMAICIDSTAYGAWLIEELVGRHLPTIIKGVNFAEKATPFRVRENYPTARYADGVRAEMHLDLADLLERHKIWADEDTAKRLNKILPFVNYKITTSGKKRICPKSEVKTYIGHSPDELDAVILAIHAEALYGAVEVNDYIV